jgi:hypothetical protein
LKDEAWRRGGERIKEVGGLRPPTSLKTSSLPRLDIHATSLCLPGEALRFASGCCARVGEGAEGLLKWS